ncbi:MAG: cytochrome c biogenesis protein ResB [Sedimentisphaerales bacterium]|nr:cytochrome c biogenesis protein ResB [Sedimentisphaerales bacterium]
MNKFRREVMWAALTLIILLTVFSIYGAFIGAARAGAFFNRIPLAIYWMAFAILLIVAFVVFPRLIRVPGLLLMHAGCILVLAGGMWGSRAGHEFQKRFLGIEKIRTGRMIVYEGHSDNRVFQDENQFEILPFSIGLKDFRIEYYEPAYLEIETSPGQNLKIPAEAGREFELGGGRETGKIVRAFENFKMSIENGQRVAFDDPRPGSNPALEIEMTDPNGEATTQYVFSLMPGFGHTQSQVKLTYHRPANRMISDYVSELEVVRDGQVVAEKDIEVNHPLHYGGYHFYQQSYDDQAGQFTILSVYSDTGLKMVFIGYWALCIGIFWHLWLRHIFARIKSKSK